MFLKRSLNRLPDPGNGRSTGNKRGSAAVLICILILTVMSALCAGYEAAERKTAICAAEAAFEIAGRNVLSCYDAALQERYGFFGYEIKQDDLKNMLKRMAAESLEYSRVGRCRVDSAEVEEAAYSLADKEQFMMQMKEIAKRSAVSSIIADVKSDLNVVRSPVSSKKDLSADISSEESRARNKVQNAVKAAEESGDEAAKRNAEASYSEYRTVKRRLTNIKNDCGKEPQDTGEDNVLRNKRITGALPSAAAGAGGITAYTGGKVIKDLSGTGSSGALSDDMYTISYISSHFKKKFGNTIIDETFFNNETEYILYGSFSDAENYRKTYMSLFAIREAVNMVYLYSDPAKRAETLAAAESLTPGFFSPVTQLIIIAAWSAAESRNDLANLEHGNGVPLVKTAGTWMISLTNLLQYGGGQYIEIPGNSPMNYGRYLDILLLTVSNDTRISRIMDLIQINMKGCVRQDFILADHFAGFSLKAGISKESGIRAASLSSAEISMTHVYMKKE